MKQKHIGEISVTIVPSYLIFSYKFFCGILLFWVPYLLFPLIQNRQNLLLDPVTGLGHHAIKCTSCFSSPCHRSYCTHTHYQIYDMSIRCKGDNWSTQYILLLWIAQGSWNGTLDILEFCYILEVIGKMNNKSMPTHTV